MQVLESYGIPTAWGASAHTVEEAIEAAERMGYPVAIKVISQQISHKSDVGGVQLNLRNREAVKAAFEDMMGRIQRAYPDARLDGVLVQPMVTGGRELILGGKQDANFGPVVLVGLGGIFVEVFEEVALRVAPITPKEAEEMISQLRGAPILMGTRGAKRSDIEAVAEALLRLSQLAHRLPRDQGNRHQPAARVPRERWLLRTGRARAPGVSGCLVNKAINHPGQGGLSPRVV